jgi:hypothetical protein
MSSEPENIAPTESIAIARSRFQLQVSLTYWGIFIGSIIAGFIIAVVYPANDSAAIDEKYNSLFVLFLAMGLVQGGVLLYFAHRSGSPFWWLVMPLAIIPIVNWLAYLIVAGYEYVPEKPKEAPIPIIVWIPIALIPCACGMLLVLSHTE